MVSEVVEAAWATLGELRDTLKQIVAADDRQLARNLVGLSDGRIIEIGRFGGNARASLPVICSYISNRLP